jgi:enolase-phosphatase E1
VSRPIQAILLDIEGTTTPIAFVTDVLFPYARAHLRRHLAERAASSDYALLFDRLRDEHSVDRRGSEVPAWTESSPAERLASVADYCEWLMDRDRKSTALKTLQGWVWEEGYARGELVGQVFDDVPPAFERWRAEGRSISIFSSGSVLAQQLLFRHSSAGDLTRFLHSFFDTTTGPKGDSASYRRIAEALAIAPEAVLFVSDVTRELEAAGNAGMQTRLSVRPGNQPQPHADRYDVVSRFDELA